MSEIIFNELVKLGSKVATEKDSAKLIKLNIATQIFNAALQLEIRDPNKSKRLVSLARTISNK